MQIKNKGAIEETITKLCQHTHSTQVRLTVHKIISKKYGKSNNKEEKHTIHKLNSQTQGSTGVIQQAVQA